MKNKMMSAIKRIMSVVLVLTLLASSPAFASVTDSNTSDDELNGVSAAVMDDFQSPDEAETAIEADGALCDDFDTKVVGNDGVAYENVDYLSVGALSRLDEETRQDYYDMCDKVAEDLNSGIDAEVAIGVDEDGELTLFADVQMLDFCTGTGTEDSETDVDMIFGDSLNETADEELENEKAENIEKYEEAEDPIADIRSENMDIIADMDTIEEETIEIPGNVFEVTNSNKNYFRNQLNNNAAIIFDSLCYAAQNGKNTATVLTGNMTLGECCSGVSAAINTYVKAFEWMDSSRKMSCTLGKTQTEIKIAKSGYYSASIESQAQSRAASIASKAREYARSSSPSDIPYGIVEYINAWVCQFSFYNNDGLGDRDKTTQAYYNCHCSYGVLLNGYGVCEGYAKATSRILDCAGIRNLYIVGNTTQGFHAWNYVYLNGRWYVLDTTWDDGGVYENKNYFLVGGAQASSYGRYPTGNHYYESIKFNYPGISGTNYVRNTYGVYDPSPEPTPVPLENPAPDIKAYSLPDATVNQSYRTSLSVSGSGSISLSITSGSLPKGLSMDSNGNISGTPAIIGTSTFTIRANNLYGYDEKTLTLKVKAVPPTITTSLLPDGMAGVDYTGRVNVNGTAPINLTVSSGSLPDGLTLNSSTGYIEGKPKKGGEFTFTVKAVNSSGSAYKQFNVNIAVDQPVIWSDSLCTGFCGEYYHDAILISIKTPVEYEIYSGSLPEGLRLDKYAGTVTGIPTKAGSYTFGVKVYNPYGRSDTSTITMTIKGVAPKIITNSLPEGTVGDYYRAEIEVKNGVGALLNIAYGDDLPNGLRFSTNNGNLVLSGVPSKSGKYSLGIILSNSYGSDQKRYSIIIAEKKNTYIPPAPYIQKSTACVVNQKMDISGLFSESYTKYAVEPKNLASVDNKGLLTARKAGKATITGYIKDGSNWIPSTERVIVVIEKPSFTVKTIQGTKANQKIYPYQYLAGTSVMPTSWTCSNEKILSVDEKSGNLSTIKEGTAKVTAIFGEGKYAAKYSVNVKITIPKISKTKIKLLTGASHTLKISNTKLAPEWYSSNNAVATVQNGIVYAKGTGSATISAVIEDVSYSCEVTVPAPLIRSNKITIKKGKTTTVGLKNTKIKPNEVYWGSTNTEIAVVDEKGRVRGVSEGTATIYTFAGGVYNGCMVTVK